MQQNLPKRKNMRLAGYNYSQAGYYFITICVNDRHNLLAQIDVGAAFCRPELTKIGQTVENEIKLLSTIYPNVFVDKHVVMPNHVHMIIAAIDAEANVETVADNGRQNAAPTMSWIIGQWKRATSIKIG